MAEKIDNYSIGYLITTQILIHETRMKINLTENIQQVTCPRHDMHPIISLRLSEPPQLICGVQCSEDPNDIRLMKLEQLINKKLECRIQMRAKNDLSLCKLISQMKQQQMLAEQLQSKLLVEYKGLKLRIQRLFAVLEKNVQKRLKQLTQLIHNFTLMNMSILALSSDPFISYVEKFNTFKPVQRNNLIDLAKYCGPNLIKQENKWDWVDGNPDTKLQASIEKKLSFVTKFGKALSLEQDLDIEFCIKSIRVVNLKIFKSVIEETMDRENKKTEDELTEPYLEGKECAEEILWVLQYMKYHSFNTQNLSTMKMKLLRKLIAPIEVNPIFQEFLLSLVRLSAIRNDFTVCSSNAAYLLNLCHFNFNRLNLRGIQLRDTNLSCGNFVHADLSNSKMSRVVIIGCDFSGANLTNAVWDDMESWELYQLKGHSQPVSSLVSSFDGNYLATGSLDKTIRIWDAHSAKVIQNIQHNQEIVTAIIFLQNDEILASASGGNKKIGHSIYFWEVKTGLLKKTLHGHKNLIHTLAYSQQNDMLASGGVDVGIVLWNTTSGSEMRKLIGHSGIVHSLAFLVGCKILASGSSDKVIILWDVKAGNEIRKLQSHASTVCTIAFSNQEQYLASAGGNPIKGGEDNIIRLWDWKNGSVVKQLTGHKSTVFTLQFSPECDILASGSQDKTLRLWDVATGFQLRKLSGLNFGVLKCIFIQKGEILASICCRPLQGLGEKNIRYWFIDKRQIRVPRNRAVNSLIQTQYGHMIEKGNQLNVSSLTGQKRLENKCGHLELVTKITFSPNGMLLASGSKDKTIKIWNAKTGKEVFELRGHQEMITALAFSRNGKLLASGSKDRTARLWDLTDGTEKFILGGHLEKVTSVAFSGDGKLLATGSLDKSIQIWDVKTGLEQQMQGHNDYIEFIAFLENYQVFAAGGKYQTVRVWEKFTKNEVYKRTDDYNITTVALTSNGQLLALATRERIIKLWNWSEGDSNQNDCLVGHKDVVISLAFSSQDDFLASSSNDKTIRIWLVSKREELKVVNMGDSEIAVSIAFSADGTILASAGFSIRLWNIEYVQNESFLRANNYERLWVQNGDYLLDGLQSNEIKVWNSHKCCLSQKLTPRCQESNVFSIASSADGKMIACAYTNMQIQIWEQQDFQTIATYSLASYQGIQKFLFDFGKINKSDIQNMMIGRERPADQLLNLSLSVRERIQFNRPLIFSSIISKETKIKSKILGYDQTSLFE